LISFGGKAQLTSYLKSKQKNGSKGSRNDKSTQEQEGEGEEYEEHIKNAKRVILPPNSGGHKEDSGPPFLLKILVFTQITRISGPPSQATKGRRKP
jgi:hypothetical protein